jgi:isocitrate dehydrogenase kinase/phosphatase
LAATVSLIDTRVEEDRMISEPGASKSDESPGDAVPTLFAVVFCRDDGAHEWWDLYFLEVAEARRWAQRELRLRRRRVGQWTAEINQLGWNVRTREFSMADARPWKVKDEGRIVRELEDV